MPLWCGTFRLYFSHVKEFWHSSDMSEIWSFGEPPLKKEFGLKSSWSDFTWIKECGVFLNWSPEWEGKAFLKSQVEKDIRPAVVLTMEWIAFLFCGDRLDKKPFRSWKMNSCLGKYSGQSFGVVWQKKSEQNNMNWSLCSCKATVIAKGLKKHLTVQRRKVNTSWCCQSEKQIYITIYYIYVLLEISIYMYDLLEI